MRLSTWAQGTWPFVSNNHRLIRRWLEWYYGCSASSPVNTLILYWWLPFVTIGRSFLFFLPFSFTRFSHRLDFLLLEKKTPWQSSTLRRGKARDRLIVPRGVLFFGISLLLQSRWRQFQQRFVKRQPVCRDRSIDRYDRRAAPKCGAKISVRDIYTRVSIFKFFTRNFQSLTLETM